MNGIEIKLDNQAIQRFEKLVLDVAHTTMEDVRSDLVSAATMPFDTGDMQNNQTEVFATDSGAVLVTDSPQARRLYFHPEYNFQQGKNTNAGADWLEPYISGDKKDFVKEHFAEELKRRLNK